jgi:hypothetical protein
MPLGLENVVSDFVGRPVLKGAVKASVLQRDDHMRDAATDCLRGLWTRRSASLMLILANGIIMCARTHLCYEFVSLYICFRS